MKKQEKEPKELTKADVMEDASEPVPEMDAMEVESASRTLMEAERVKANPKLYEAAKKKMAEQKGHLEAALGGKKVRSIEDIKKASYNAED